MTSAAAICSMSNYLLYESLGRGRSFNDIKFGMAIEKKDSNSDKKGIIYTDDINTSITVLKGLIANHTFDDLLKNGPDDITSNIEKSIFHREKITHQI